MSSRSSRQPNRRHNDARPYIGPRREDGTITSSNLPPTEPTNEQRGSARARPAPMNNRRGNARSPAAPVNDQRGSAGARPASVNDQRRSARLPSASTNDYRSSARVPIVERTEQQRNPSGRPPMSPGEVQRITDIVMERLRRRAREGRTSSTSSSSSSSSSGSLSSGFLPHRSQSTYYSSRGSSRSGSGRSETYYYYID
ncbi:MAG: hypothetical protein M1835_001699 [Candelina submexicana]|nr:MAG: hypothetical protein M1835_001699 [Candelina submexicana]